jgi:hypothetical protein
VKATPLRNRPCQGVAFAALLLLAFAASAADAGNPSALEAPFALALPDKPWRLLVQLPGFEMEPVQRLPGGARALGVAERSGVTVSLTLASSPQDPSAKSCRDHDWAGRQKASLPREQTRLSADGDWARVDFLVPSVDAKSAPEKHVLLYLQRDGVCAVVHVLKLRYQPADADSLERLLASARFGS